jgi:hypothetical protein
VFFVKITVINEVKHPYVRYIRYGSLLYGLVADVNNFAVTSVSFLRYSRVGHAEHVNKSVKIQSIPASEVDHSLYGKNISYTSSIETTSLSLIGTSAAGYVGAGGNNHLLDVRFSLECWLRDDAGNKIYPHQFRGLLKNSDFYLGGRPWLVNTRPFSEYLARVTSAASSSGFASYWSSSSTSRHVFPRFKGSLNLVPIGSLSIRNGYAPGVTSRKLTSFPM